MQNDYLTIGHLQIKILKSLWALGPATVHDILADWQGKGERNLPAYVTVLTVLRRLEARKLLTHTQIGRSFTFRTEVDEFAFKQAMVERIADTLFDGVAGLHDFVHEAELGTFEPKPTVLDDLRVAINGAYATANGA